MKQITRISILALGAILALTSAAQADCYADYKAKQDNPLRLHYGVAQVTGACSTGNATQQIKTRLGASGWTLLQIQSVFGPDGLEQRKDSAGQYYLRF